MAGAMIGALALTGLSVPAASAAGPGGFVGTWHPNDAGYQAMANAVTLALL